MVNVIAHRGFSASYPENTAVAFLQAIALGVDMIEFDVRLTRDRALVIVHDDTVDRTSNGAGRIAEMTLSEVQALDAGGWFRDRFAGERFLTLAEALEVIGAGARLNVELKASDEDRHELVPLALAELERSGCLDRGFIASDQHSIELAKRIQPQVEICNLTRAPRDNYIARSLALGCRVLQPGNTDVDLEFVQQAHDSRMEVNPFYANDEEEMNRLIRCGVDGILTDRPDLLIGLQGK